MNREDPPQARTIRHNEDCTCPRCKADGIDDTQCGHIVVTTGRQCAALGTHVTPAGTILCQQHADYFRTNYRGKVVPIASDKQ